ncbi:MAG: SoxY-related AACIE arm protein [Alphaproteobacteria bacterium]|nr:SoxY-related AACIE arm protein [Alphaproteobacteria bacterium]
MIPSPSRRDVLIGAGLTLALRPRDVFATPEMMQEALRKIVGEATVTPGKVTLDLPPLVENGNVVPLSVAVESPMTEQDHVKAIHVLNQKNPQPYVIAAYLGPRSGVARISTRIKLADAQTVIAVAEMSDGSFWSGSADIVVTIAACVEDPS